MHTAEQEIRTSMHELFAAGDLIVCPGGEETFRIVAVLDDQIRLVSIREGSEIAIAYRALGQESNAHDGAATVERPPAEDCLMLEYHRRADQARRDAEVDAMWRSAMTCQL